jgi:hypothetical protein
MGWTKFARFKNDGDSRFLNGVHSNLYRRPKIGDNGRIDPPTNRTWDGLEESGGGVTEIDDCEVSEDG